MSRRDTGRKAGILKGHKRVGKRFVPPMMQIPKMVNTSFVDDMLPELIWIGLINERVGYVRGARTIEKVFLSVDALIDNTSDRNFALMSSFDSLDKSQKVAFVDALLTAGVLDIVRISVAPLLLLYDDCPLNFMGAPTEECSNEELTRTLKRCVGKVINRYDTPGVALYGAMLIARLVTGTITLPAGPGLPNFNAIIESPESDEAERAASFMRAHALAEFGALRISNSWARHFWDRNIELSPCEFASL